MFLNKRFWKFTVSFLTIIMISFVIIMITSHFGIDDDILNDTVLVEGASEVNI